MELFLLPLKKERIFSGFHWDKKASPYTYSWVISPHLPGDFKAQLVGSQANLLMVKWHQGPVTLGFNLAIHNTPGYGKGIPQYQAHPPGLINHQGKLKSLPSRKLTYPTWRKGTSSSNLPYQGEDMLIPWRVQLGNLLLCKMMCTTLKVHASHR